MYKVRSIISLVLIFMAIASLARAQEILPSGQFHGDSIKIGIPVPYSLSIKYPKSLDVLFPDSLYDYSPYEFEKKLYFPTQSDSLYSYDSAVYYITSFEIDTVQYFKLPVFIVVNGDSSSIFAQQDSVILTQLVAEIPDSVTVEAMPLIENTTHKRVGLQFNYPYYLIGSGILIILGLLVLIIFGKKIRRSFRLRRLRKGYLKFIERYDRLVTQNDQPRIKAEKILIHWKKYLEKLESIPYTKLTTKEILKRNASDLIETPLKGIDRILYAPENGNMKMDDNYMALKKYAYHQFQTKIEEVKNG